MTKQNRAFSLIEILIALAILGLIASLVLPVVKQRRDTAAYDVSRLNLFQVSKAMEKHYLEKGVYPSFQTWTEVHAENSPLREYLNDIPKVDGFGRDYEIVTSDESGYEFEGFGLDGHLKDNYPDYTVSTGSKQRKGKKKSL